jgi:hypothetical protein
MIFASKKYYPSDFLAATLALGLLVAAAPAPAGATPEKPTCTIASPANNATITNSEITIKGTTHDNVAVTNVFYDLNGTNGWMMASHSNGFTNWSAQIMLAAGPNTFKVYAVNTNGQSSATNGLNVFYELVAPLSVSVNGPGQIKPNYNTSNLVIGKTYSMIAVPEAGCKLTNWSLSLNSSTPTNSTSAALKFIMAAGLAITAHFVDATPPVISDVAVNPPASAKSSNSVASVSGKARDNVGVKSIFYTINGGPANRAVLTTNCYTNWTAMLILNQGANDVKFYAQDAAGNTSSAASITLTDESGGFAPQSVSGLILRLDPASSSTTTLFCGPGTYAYLSGSKFGVGDYFFTQIDSNAAQFAYQDIAPAGADESSVVTLTFASTTSGTYTNEDGASGPFTMNAETNAAPSSLDRTTLALHGYTSTSSADFTNGTFTWTTQPSGNMGSGTYTYALYSPQTALLTATYTDDVDLGITNFVLLNFYGAPQVVLADSSQDAGNIFDITNGGGFNFEEAAPTGVNYDSGSFSTTSPASAPSGYAPESLAGRTAAVTARHTETNNGKTTVVMTTPLVSFGAATYGQIDSNTNDDSDVGNYLYTRTGPDTGLLSFYPIAPPSDNNHNTGIVLNFSASGASFTNGKDSGNITLSLPAATVPPSLVGTTLSFTPAKGSGTVATFGYGTFTSTGNGAQPEPYIFGQFGPKVALLQIEDISATNYITLWFASASPPSGKYVSVKIESGAMAEVSSGTFKP